ncbi:MULTISPECIES: M15 family metallopeptidase [Exiguobacterium]|uniref:M15 family metallopeptidase n=1 Tax=Exiguobacterium TaxID=33986 RepID=UPI000285E800|nr:MULTISPECIES: M15 family metallopeptidase [Exiguobacterium]AFS70788.1 D-alanyl-D-alanine carboxypeptidase [Exiguobacterium antarcticum B7]MCT4779650.1 M15 family metallopeptidase [Exiguobacterium soli]OIN67939.1 peptidase M15 [Exiguobacterium sp. KRL4]
MKRGTLFVWILFLLATFAIGLFLAASTNRMPSILIDQPELGIESCPRDRAGEDRLINASAKNLKGLHPAVRAGAEDLIRVSHSCYNIDIRITQGYRTNKQQDVLYEQGRSRAGDVVTNARGGESMHNYGLAIDFVQMVDGDISYDLEYDGNQSGKSDWREVAAVGKALGFEWGGDWKRFVDYPHFEMTFGYSLDELQDDERPSRQEKANRTEEIETLLNP